MKHTYWVNIVSNKSKKVLYTGVTRDLAKRIKEHRENHEIRNHKAFTGRYHCYFLVYYEEHKYILNAIAREKEIKNWISVKKIELIESIDPDWQFLEAPSRDDKGFPTK